MKQLIKIQCGKWQKKSAGKKRRKKNGVERTTLAPKKIQNLAVIRNQNQGSRENDTKHKKRICKAIAKMGKEKCTNAVVGK